MADNGVNTDINGTTSSVASEHALARAKTEMVVGKTAKAVRHAVGCIDTPVTTLESLQCISYLSIYLSAMILCVCDAGVNDWNG